MRVIGSGFGRTGTLSLKLALEELGLGPCYHMEEVMRTPAHVEVWNDVGHGRESTGISCSRTTTPRSTSRPASSTET